MELEPFQAVIARFIIDFVFYFVCSLITSSSPTSAHTHIFARSEAH